MSQIVYTYVAWCVVARPLQYPHAPAIRQRMRGEGTKACNQSAVIAMLSKGSGPGEAPMPKEISMGRVDPWSPPLHQHP